MKYYYTLFLGLLLTSCQLHDENSETAVDVAAKEWAEAYFNFDYKEALKYMTPESGQWIRFAASNISEEDISFIKEHGVETKINITDSQMSENDSLCQTRIRVSDFIQLGMDPEESRVIDEADFLIQLVKRNDKWLVKTEGLPQSEMQSLD